MNIDVNTNKLINLLKEYDEYISSYEETLEDLFYELEKVNTFWNGADKDHFSLLMDEEELNYELLINKMKKISDYYHFSLSEYNSFYTSLSSEVE